ncbi:MAG TPA: type II secretion system F family protein [Candidatus Rifleibacterium sp.]|nr:type II secretion system F family protein [Candidatus Rifleibacterium sp.]HPT45749.1 type II secretion system F family protein [Candidatus Rifleibacterium sp.]
MSKRFAYKALDVKGKPMEGFMEATTAEEVGTWLADRNYFVLEIAAAPLQGLVSGSNTHIRISTQAMNFFLLQLSSLINAGCPLIMSLHALYRQLPNSPLKKLLKDLREKIESGKSFSDSLKCHREVFSNLFITMVEVGEIGGILGEILERYAHIHDAMYRLRSKIVKSMIYPAILLLNTIIVAWALLVYVFPVFIEKIQSNGNELPLPTRIVLSASNFLTGHSLLIISGIGLLIALFFLARSSEKGSRFLARATISMPLAGPVIQQMEMSLFARILGTLLKCGVPILTSLQAVEKALNNVIYKEALNNVREAVSRGESLSQSISRYRDLFPESIILMTDVGERGGNTGEMLEKAGIIYERDLELTLETAVTLIQPALVIFLAVFVVTLTLAMYMPLFDIIKTVR